MEEGFAQFWQIYMEAELTGKYPDSKFYDLRLSKINSPVYNITIHLCRDFLGTIGYDALPILSDLALLGPMITKTNVTNKRYDWEDIHPGWRFCRGLSFVKENNLMEKLSVAFFDTEEGYDVLTRAICNAFDWPTPDEITNRILDGKPFPWAENGPFAPTVKALTDKFEQSWKTRRKYPHAFAFPIHCASQMGESQPPALFGQKGIIRIENDQDIFLSILAQEIIASGFLNSPQDQHGNPLPGFIECPVKVLGLDYGCKSTCEGRFPHKREIQNDCWLMSPLKKHLV